MSFDPMTANPCPDFCSEFCEVGLGEYSTRHRSAGMLAARGGPIDDKDLIVESIDIVPSAGVVQDLGGKPAEVFLRVDAWMGNGPGTWSTPRDLGGLSSEQVFTAERALHLGELLIEAAREALATPLSPPRVTELGVLPILRVDPETKADDRAMRVIRGGAA